MPLAAESPTLPLRCTMRPLPVGEALNDTLGAESLTVAEPVPPCPQGSVTDAVTSPSPEASASNEKLPLASAVVDPVTTPEKLTVKPLAASSPTLPLRCTMRPLPVGEALNDTLGGWFVISLDSIPDHCASSSSACACNSPHRRGSDEFEVTVSTRSRRAAYRAADVNRNAGRIIIITNPETFAVIEPIGSTCHELKAGAARQ